MPSALQSTRPCLVRCEAQGHAQCVSDESSSDADAALPDGGEHRAMPSALRSTGPRPVRCGAQGPQGALRAVAASDRLNGLRMPYCKPSLISEVINDHCQYDLQRGLICEHMIGQEDQGST